MAVQTYAFEGKAKWAQIVTPDKKYGDYRMLFYPKNDDVRKAIKATGTRCGVKEDDNGFFYQFKNEAAPKVTMDGEPFVKLVGNGSDVTIHLSVEDFTSTKYGKVVRTRLLAVDIINLVPYERPTAEAKPDVELPA